MERQAIGKRPLLKFKKRNLKPEYPAGNPTFHKLRRRRQH
jgi:hypothetical protein